MDGGEVLATVHTLEARRALDACTCSVCVPAQKRQLVTKLRALAQALAHTGAAADRHSYSLERMLWSKGAYLLAEQAGRIEAGELCDEYIEDLAKALAGVNVTEPEAP